MTGYRKPALLFTATLLLSACDVSEEMRSQSGSSSGNARAIAAKGGCMGCHTVYNSVYGPAWKLVSERYQQIPGAESQLISSIKQGSYGRWDKITGGKRMPPQDGALSDEELEVVVDYILSLTPPAQGGGTTTQ